MMKRVWNKYREVPRGLLVIGVRLYPMDNLSLAACTDIRSMQKSLYGHKEWFYFYEGVKITDTADDRHNVFLPEGIFDPDFMLYRSDKHPREPKEQAKHYLDNINISAIIGENGTGKSTLVDMIIRVLNNLSAAIFGENYIYSSAQHLHYIENVYASLAFFIDSEVKILTVKGHDITLETLIQNSDCEKDGLTFEGSLPKQIVLEGRGSINTAEVLQGNVRFVSLLKNWFYTIVINYSLYAYNYRDYIYEQTVKQKIDVLRNQMDEAPNEEDYYWLKGVFHKNDGYQTPIVVTPMRQDGYINAQKENHLGKQNLISLAFIKVEREGGEGEFPFRVINQTHHIVSFFHNWIESAKYEGFEKHYLLGRRFVEKAEEERMRPIWNRKIESYEPIKDFWVQQITGGCNLRNLVACSKTNQQKQVWDYVVYKTFKIMENYVVYKDTLNFFFGKDYDKGKIADYLIPMMKDSTHRTRKLRRALSFLKYYSGHYSLQGSKVDVDDIYNWMKPHLGEPLYVTNNYHLLKEEDLLPPAPCNVSLGLVDEKHWVDYQRDKANFKEIIAFGGLSSGERQIAYSISSLMYHLINIDSTVDDQNMTSFETIHYKHANIMMDEVELYFHPDLQRRYIKLLVDSLNSMKWTFLSSVNITLITHSPFVLSDIPSTNLLCLTKDGTNKPFGKTFAANIHDLFNNTFILPDTIGELAREEIARLATTYRKQVLLWYDNDSSDEKRGTCQESLDDYLHNKDRYKYLCSIVGDDYLREELQDMFDELDEFYTGRAL